ncbi:MAG TPA: HEAT repeat domain-containing protein [Syntrophobacteria bacterium]|nr:HEAT repeat domain-containing protein [Syntrophobacteria bacterium]
MELYIDGGGENELRQGLRGWDGMRDRRWRGRELKELVLGALRSEDRVEGLTALAGLPPRQVVNPLFSFFCSTDSAVRWRAVTAMGAVVTRLAGADIEAARVIMRRMIWQLNEESGGIGWGIPEAMGETMTRHAGLAEEYAHMLVSYIQEEGNFLEHVPLQRGVLWGLGRLAGAQPSLVKKATADIEMFLSAEDAQLRALAAWILGLIGAQEARARLEKLRADRAEVLIYGDWREERCTVSELAGRALAALDGTSS